MVKEIVFNNLPFVPISGQVIYVESSYHERLNTFIHDHYIWLRELFENCGFEFCYLPSLSEEAIRYRVPTLTPEKSHLQTNHRGTYLTSSPLPLRRTASEYPI